VPLVTIGVFCMAGLVAGLAGFLDTAHFLTASPTAGSQDLLLAVAAVVIGGTPLEGGEGSIVGTVIGALIISVLQNGFVILDVQSYWQLVAVGVVTVAAVYFGERDRISRLLKSA
jgi:ribose transport system permease protein